MCYQILKLNSIRMVFEIFRTVTLEKIADDHITHGMHEACAIFLSMVIDQLKKWLVIVNR